MAKSAQTPIEYSLSEARSHLDEMVEQAAAQPVRIVRGSKPPVMLLSGEEYDRLQKPNIMDLIEQWRALVGPEGLDDGTTWTGTRPD